MKFKFKIQDYQTEAVTSTVDVLSGQPLRSGNFLESLNETRNIKKEGFLMEEFDDLYANGYANNSLKLSDTEILTNLNKIQEINSIEKSQKLIKKHNVPVFDIEMETGTGKTYVYIKTMYEMNLKYGFSKFIVVVPSIAIREGVKKTFETTASHFMKSYNKKIRHFIYDSSKLDEIEHFNNGSAINVMIINMQAFNSRTASSRRIYEEIDIFNSRRPIDVIAQTNPIIIMDEPQKMGGKATQEALANFNPLFYLNYSATHKEKNNLIYVLDALDAYTKKIVKKIEVKGFQIKNLRGSNGYLFLHEIILSNTKSPSARVELEISYNNSINRETRILNVGDNLYHISKEMEQYKGFVISDIDAYSNKVSFTNGEVLEVGTASGDVSENDLRRIQIRETIKSHFEKEEFLFNKGIKVLSLFFIDEVKKYRLYDEDGQELNSIYGDIFEEEYKNIYEKYIEKSKNDFYKNYLKGIDVTDTHKGYFSIDKKTKKSIDPILKGKNTESDDIEAYDLILKDKERLLSFKEPTRFIFSHSALREGWDNPNIFQICTLKYSESDIQRHQEVGRGLRICVNQNGDRMDSTYLNGAVHDVNKLTVIANESYEDFTSNLQKDIREKLYNRPLFANREFFLGKIINIANQPHTISNEQATSIYRYLLKNDYIDDNDRITDLYKENLLTNTLADFTEDLKPLAEGIKLLIASIFDDSVLITMFENAQTPIIDYTKVNDNFYKKEFQELWSRINKKYSYRVDFDSSELIQNAIKTLDNELTVSSLIYTVTTGLQDDDLDRVDIRSQNSFNINEKSTHFINQNHMSKLRYDLVGKISKETFLSRKSIVSILKGLKSKTFNLFKENPEDFIAKVSKIINEQKATLIIEKVSYNAIENEFDIDIFTNDRVKATIDNTIKSSKHVKDFVLLDGISANSIERNFVKELDLASEVSVYAKLPSGFHISTPMGNYNPDWAIAFYEGTVKHIYFIAETKGSLSSLQLRKMETMKIKSAQTLFDTVLKDQVSYGVVDSYKSLLDLLNK